MKYVVIFVAFICILLFYYFILKHITFKKKTLYPIVILFAFTIFSPYLSTNIQILISFALSIFLAYHYSKDAKLRSRPIPVSALIILYVCVLTIAVSLRYFAFNNAMLDLGNMLQPIFNTAQGKFMSLSGAEGNIVRFSGHKELIYLLLVPFVKIFPSGITILFLQTLLVGLSAIAINKIAFLITDRKDIAFMIAGAFLLYLPLQFSNLADVHGDTIGIFFISFAIYFYLKRKLCIFTIFMFLSMSCKEYIPLIFFFWGIAMLIFEKRYISGVIACTLSLFFYFGILKFIGSFYPVAFTSENLHFSQSFTNHFLNIANMEKWKNIAMLFVPFLFLSLKKWRTLIPTLPIFGGILLSGHGNVANIRWHHWSTILPFIVLALVLEVKTLKKCKILVKPLNGRDPLIFLIIYIIAFSFLSNGSGFGYRFWHPEEYYFFNSKATYGITQHDKLLINELKKYKDPALRITTTQMLATHLCMREHVNLLMWNDYKRIDRSDFVIFSYVDLFINAARGNKMEKGISYVRRSDKFTRISIYPLEIYKHK